MRSRYFSCSKFADWLRGTPKLSCGTSEEWRDWEISAKQSRPIRYWLAEEGLDYIQEDGEILIKLVRLRRSLWN